MDINFMDPSNKPLSAFLIIDEGFRSFKKNFSISGLIIVFTFLLPQLLFFLHTSFRSQQSVDQLWRLSGDYSITNEFYQLLSVEMASYAMEYFAIWIGLWLFFVTGYMSLVDIAIRTESDRPLDSVRSILGKNLKKNLASGLILSLLMGLIFFIGQAIMAPMIILGILALIAPVILVQRGSRPLTAISDAVFFKYAQSSQISIWQIFFSLGGCIAILYGMMLMTIWLKEQTLILDQTAHLDRWLWSASFLSFPFSPVYLVTQVFYLSVTMMLLGFLPTISTRLYFEVIGRREKPAPQHVQHLV
jgi:hypothetical protein